MVSWVQAGEFSEAVDPYPVGIGDEDEVVYAPVPVSKSAFALAVQGDSMYPRYWEGDTIIVDPEVRCESGDPVIVKVNDEVVFKVLHREEGRIRLSSINTKYGSIIYDEEGGADVRVVGKVVAHLGKG